MHLKTLTMRGFKSFASTTTLSFEPGITCIVGPNGSGKSNVVDALSWVMGEQGAKTLRGGKMEDVIFAGTSNRPPLGRAQVELTIDNTDGALPIEYTEVTISRTMFRNGGSEYAINGTACRLLDVQELLSDTGMGNEMHVIVGQGRLDSILGATPESRRGFVEEAAGILKHRKRKDKALRKLDATSANLDRLNDLIGEIRRQLGPLGRQAQVARKAAIIQTELRDAKARLLADDLAQLQDQMAADAADEAAREELRRAVSRRLELAQEAEARAEADLAAASPVVSSAQETWYALSALRERVQTSIQIAGERIRNARNVPEPGSGGRSPDELEAEAVRVGGEHQALVAQTEQSRKLLDDASAQRSEIEKQHTEAERRYAAALRAIADRREGLARLTGKVDSLRSKLDAGSDEVQRLEARRDEALERASRAQHDFAALETKVAGLTAGEDGLDRAYEQAMRRVGEIADAIAELRATESELANRKAALQARVEALQAHEARDGSAGLLAMPERPAGLRGALAEFLQVHDGWEKAVAVALGSAAEALVMADFDAAAGALQVLKAGDLGRAGMLLADASVAPDERPTLPPGAHWVLDLVAAPDDLRPGLSRVLRRVAAVESMSQAEAVVDAIADISVVTRDGDLVSSWFAAGGSAGGQSQIEVQAAIAEAVQQVDEVTQELERTLFAIAEQANLEEEAKADADAALERLNESDAEMAAVAEQLGSLGQAQRQAKAEAERHVSSIEQAKALREQDEQTLAELTARLEAASSEEERADPDPTERDHLAVQAQTARQAEMEARLALRTAEERAKAIAGRADSLRRAAAAERAARAKAAARAERLAREGEQAEAVHAAATWLLQRVDSARDAAATEREAAELALADAQRSVADARRATREVAAELDTIQQGAHHDEMARIEQKMRLEQLSTKAIDELGLLPDVLVAEYGPDQPVPVLTGPDGEALTEDDPRPDPIPFDRAQQEKRLRVAEGNLKVLGRVNPLALEEFDALQERHAFLAEQLEDLKKTRAGLLDIVDEVDKRVEEVFKSAYEDISETFGHVFSRLFPGGEGRLVLTDPDDWLTTGIEVEARPAGKKVKRLSLLSGGERSLVAVAFLFSLFIARPSPFYILDEVEAALDDVNLGRLLGIYQELRERAQLLVITHQKRTMEIADALYGVTMRGDGVSTVISQRLNEG